MEFVRDPETGIYSSESADFTVKVLGVLPKSLYRFLVNYKGLNMGFGATQIYTQLTAGEPEKKIFPTYEFSWFLDFFELPRNSEKMKLINCNYKKDFLERMLIFLWTYTNADPKQGLVGKITLSENVEYWLNFDHKNKYYSSLDIQENFSDQKFMESVK